MASGIRIVHNKLLGGWFIVRGPHQTPISGNFPTKEAAQQSLIDAKNRRDGFTMKKNPRRRSYIYVGLHNGKREVFRSKVRPTEKTHGDLYSAVIGPFYTLQAAQLAVKPHGPLLQSVADFERIVAQGKLMKKNPRRRVLAGSTLDLHRKRYGKRARLQPVMSARNTLMEYNQRQKRILARLSPKERKTLLDPQRIARSHRKSYERVLKNPQPVQSRIRHVAVQVRRGEGWHTFAMFPHTVEGKANARYYAKLAHRRYPQHTIRVFA